MITDEQTAADLLAAAEGRLTELHHAFVDAAYDADERHRLAKQIREKRDEITRLYNLLPAA